VALCGGALAGSLCALAPAIPAVKCERLVPNRQLFEAALAGKASEVESCMEEGGQPDGYLDENGVSALIGACNNGHLAVARLLLDNGASPDLQVW
jgi:ankyrin repeat protein